MTMHIQNHTDAESPFSSFSANSTSQQPQGDLIISIEESAALLARGIEPREIDRQFRLLSSPPPKISADRACTFGDGIDRILAQEKDHLRTLARCAVHEGRLTDFIPASGAASRMFPELINALKHDNMLSSAEYFQAALNSSDPATQKTAKATDRFFTDLRKFAFFEELREIVRQRSEGALDISNLENPEFFDGRSAPLVIDSLLFNNGLNYTQIPKALLAFHRYPDGSVRTSIEEQLRTAAQVGSDKYSVCRLHFTRSPEHVALFDALFQKLLPTLEATTGVSYQVSFSEQLPVTDTISLKLSDNTLARANGGISFRPGGHGSLLQNLSALNADIVYLNNSDNSQPETKRAEFIDSKLMLIGKLVERQDKIFTALNTLEQGAVSLQYLDDLKQNLLPTLNCVLDDACWSAADADERASMMRRVLNRPIRIAGMVKNEGEPGGGPFWAPNADGTLSPQILEQAEFDTSQESQREILKSGTHFNPVRMVCGLRDYTGVPFQLELFVNNEAVFMSEKTLNGEAIRVFERPGLWNGSMSNWITLFVEVDSSTFSPVKTVLDLARPSHQV